MNEMPVVGPKTAAQLQAFIDHPEPPIADTDWIQKQITMLSIKPSRKQTVSDAKMILQTYTSMLKSYSRADLGYAFGRLMRESKWFPDISEIIQLAEFPKSQRNFKKLQARTLIMKHERDWIDKSEDKEAVDPEEVRALINELSVGGEKVASE